MVSEAFMVTIVGMTAISNGIASYKSLNELVIIVKTSQIYKKEL